MGKNSTSSGDNPLPDAPLDRAALSVKRDRDHTPQSPPESAGLIRYKKGIVLLVSLLLIGISLSTIHTAPSRQCLSPVLWWADLVLQCCGENTPEPSATGIVFLRPDSHTLPLSWRPMLSAIPPLRPLIPRIRYSRFFSPVSSSRHDNGSRPPSRPPGIVVRSPEGDCETYPEGASLADALDRWGVDTAGIDEDILSGPLPAGCRVRLTGDPESPVVLEPLDATDLFILGIPFNINTASVDELSLIPGIGERLSGRIVARREEHGPFLCARDLAAVPGIGAKKTETIMEYVIFYDMLDGPEDTQ